MGKGGKGNTVNLLDPFLPFSLTHPTTNHAWVLALQVAQTEADEAAVLPPCPIPVHTITP
eukprot:357331-Chlamydomonas_euryale.AAC.2